MSDQRIPQQGEVWRTTPFGLQREILAVISKGGYTFVLVWNEADECTATYDLRKFLGMYEPVPTIPHGPAEVFPMWVNVYVWGVVPHDTREAADGGFADVRIALVRWDGWDDDGKLIGEVVQ